MECSDVFGNRVFHSGIRPDENLLKTLGGLGHRFEAAGHFALDLETAGRDSLSQGLAAVRSADDNADHTFHRLDSAHDLVAFLG